MLKIHTLTYNPLQENTYILSSDNGECIIIDPGCLSANEQNHFADYIAKNSLKPVRLLNTHLHFDHVFGNRFVCERYNLAAEAHKDDEFWIENTIEFSAQMGIEINQNPPALKGYLEHNQKIEVNDSSIIIKHIPGHTPGGIIFYLEKEKSIIAGDVLFRQSVGRSDFPGGNHEELIEGIKEHLLSLPDETIVYPGHGPTTTIGYEKNHNPYLV